MPSAVVVSSETIFFCTQVGGQSTHQGEGSDDFCTERPQRWPLVETPESEINCRISLILIWYLFYIWEHFLDSRFWGSRALFTGVTHALAFVLVVQHDIPASHAWRCMYNRRQKTQFDLQVNGRTRFCLFDNLFPTSGRKWCESA